MEKVKERQKIGAFGAPFGSHFFLNLGKQLCGPMTTGPGEKILARDSSSLASGEGRLTLGFGA
jgi:hypothetical protein